MKIAFYAPMKSPDDAQPSGDRTIGRLLIAALSRCGADVRLVSQLRTWSGSPNPDLLRAYRADAQNEVSKLIAGYQAGDETPNQKEPDHEETEHKDWQPDLWFTYHSYYKAPDLVGPAVASALGIPYVITEASYAARRAEGPWAAWLAATRESIEAADAIFSFTQRDKRGLQSICAAHRLHDLKPFLDLTPFARPQATSTLGRRHDRAHPVRLVTIGMMRQGAKLASYQLLAASLRHLLDADWHLDVIGDGLARADVEQAFSHLPSERLTWHGVLEASDVREVLANHDLFVWPGIEEAFGMAFLEAQASGLPVAAVRTAGVPEVVHHDQSGLLARNAGDEAYGDCLRLLIRDAELRSRLSSGALSMVKSHHSIDAASARLNSVLGSLVSRKQIPDHLP